MALTSSATILFSSPLTITVTGLPSLPCTRTKYQKIRQSGRKLKLTTATTVSCCMRRRNSEAADNYGSGAGRLVDENMIVLRKRIHETKMIERNYEPPSEWMDWEKSFYTSYDSLICEAVGILQSRLMDTRPSVALALIALVTFSVPTTTLMGMIRLMELISGILAPIHLG